jgi:hypothetical protein
MFLKGKSAEKKISQDDLHTLSNFFKIYILYFS